MAERNAADRDFNHKTLCICSRFKDQLEKMQTRNPGLLKKVMQKLERLSTMESSALFAYLRSQDSKKFHNYTAVSSADLSRRIFKFRLDSGERILFTFGSCVNYLSSEYADRIILLAIASHDKQSSQSGFESDLDRVETLTDLTSGEDVAGAQDLTDFDVDPVKLTKNFAVPDYRLESADEFFVADVDHYPEDNLELLDVILSKEQGELITEFTQRSCPMIITGGAGTGKTILLSHIFHNFVTVNPGENVRSIYFTNSRFLLDNVRAKVKFINGVYGIDDITQRPNVMFTDISTFLKDILRSRISRDISLISYDDFYRFCRDGDHLNQFFRDHNVKLKDVPSPYQMWTEIRGCIKGGLSSEWLRTEPVSQEAVEHDREFRKGFEQLLRHGLLMAAERGSTAYIFPDEPPQSFLQLRNSSGGEERQELDDLLRLYRDLKKKFRRKWEMNVAVMPMRDLEEYIHVTGELSDISDNHLKRVCWEFCRDYDRTFRDDPDPDRLRIDDNDLARMVLARPEFAQSLEGTYDLVVIDEVQDYTDLQVYLISRLAKKLLIIAGDQHQIINPSFFHPDKLKFLPKIAENTPADFNEVQTLGINFRSTSVVIHLLNSLISFRQQKIGNMERRSENPEVILESKGERMGKFRNINAVDLQDRKAVDHLFRTFQGHNAEFSYVAVLVPDEETKQLLISRWGFLRTMLFTLSEIKGLEYQFVICCNMFTSSFEIWRKILSSTGKTKETRYRFIFNQLYVAVSRAVKSIAFVEDFAVLNPRRDHGKIGDIFYRILGCVVDFPDETMDWKELISQFRISSNIATVIKNIEHLIYINKYDTAIMQYQELAAAEGISRSVRREIGKCIDNCKRRFVSYLIEDRVEIRQGLLYAFILGYEDLIQRYQDRLQKTDPLYRLICIRQDSDYLSPEHGFAWSGTLFSDLYAACYGSFDGGVFVTEADRREFLSSFRRVLAARFEKTQLEKRKKG